MDSDGDLDIVGNMASSVPTQLLTNLRATTNRPPVANAGPDRTFPYQQQFRDEDMFLSAAASQDPDLHALAYEWRYNGQVFSHESYPYPPRWLRPGAHTFELTVRDGRGGEARDSVRS